ncbi:MAG: phosphate/phosphite/phosphonate ABC transporter substrate-binding protein [Thermodesulfovibrionales bacterium]|nr:phosphate/phosphite/phosphonate ABC transporter substrate-binding protein [Thermodesulfovibrionales bacterium]
MSKVVSLIIIVFTLWGCNDADVKPVTEQKQHEVLSDQPPINILVLPEERTSIVVERFMPLKYYLEDYLKRHVVINVSKDFEGAIKSIFDRADTIAILDPAIYCELKKRYPKNVIPLVKTYFKEDRKSYSVLVAKDTSQINNPADAKGKRLALGHKNSSFSYLNPLSMLNDVKIKPEDLASVSFLEQEDRVALSVLIGEHDVGGMSETVAKKYLSDGLKIIKRSEPVARFVVVASTVTDKKVKDKITEAFVNFRNVGHLSAVDPTIGGFKVAEDRDFDVTRAMIYEVTGKDYREYGQNVIKVAILPLYSATTIYERYDPLIRYLSENTGYEFKLFIPKNFEDFINRVKAGEAHFSYQNPFVYAIIDKEYKLNPLVTTIGEDTEAEATQQLRGFSDDKFRGVIITRKDSPIKKIEELRGKRVLITSPKSAGGFLSQKIYLNSRGIEPEKDMILIDGKKQENVIVGVYRGEADAGFVRESALVVWKDSVDMSKIKVLAYTEVLPNWPFASSNHTNPQLAKKVKNLLINLKDETILKSARIKGFKEASEEVFEPLKRYY